MNKELTKPNDIFVATLTSPTASVTDLLRNSITADNTSFLSYDEYKETPLVKKKFTDSNGVFDEQGFSDLYKLAAQKYVDLSDKKVYDKWSKELEYSAQSIYRPLDAKIRNESYNLTLLDNPLGKTLGVEGVNKWGQARFTEEEAAQRNRIYDPETGEWLNETPESLSLLDKVFGKTLVYAKYDRDEVDPITKEIHYKGEWKKDKDGNYYTEILNSDDLLGKQVVSLSDILTKEDSWLNKIDFFDSDGYEKSVAGVAAKTTAAIIPWLIPGFNKYYGAMTASFALASVLPTFYKAFDHMLNGEEDSFMSSEATKLENWFRKFEGSKSQEGREGFWNLESIGQLTADIFGQLYQQRAAASLAKYFTSGEKELELGQRFSLAYMGLISSNDVYNSALEGGYDERTAGIAALATAGALYGIMNFNETTRGIGTWFLNKTTGESQEIARAPIIKAAKKLLPKFKEGIDEFAKTGSKKTLAESVTAFKVTVKDNLQNAVLLPTESLWKSAIVEGVEEVSEEVVQDTVKGIIDTMSWLGYTGSKGSFGGWENVFSQQGLERYMATLVGGAAGGALFHANMDYIEPFLTSLKTGDNKLLKKVDYDIYDIIARGQTDQLVAELNKLRSVYKNNLAPTERTLSDGTKVAQVATDGQTQADLIIDAAIKRVQMLDRIIKRVSPQQEINFQEAFMRRARFKQLEDSGFIKAIDSDYIEACKKLAESTTALDNLLNEEKPNQDEKKRLENLIQEQTDYVKSFYSGESNIKYAMQAGAMFNGDIRRAFTDLDKSTWLRDVKKVSQKDYDSNAELREKLDTEYKEWIDDLKGDDLTKSSKRVIDVLLPLLKSQGEGIRKFVSSKHKKAFMKKLFESVLPQDILDSELERISKEVRDDSTIAEGQKESEIITRYNKLIADMLLTSKPGSFIELIKTNPNAFSLSDYWEYDLAQELINKKIITIDPELAANSEVLEIIKTLINNIAINSRLNVWNKESLRRLINNEVSARLSESNPFTTRINELLSETTDESDKKKKSKSKALLDLKATKPVTFNEDVDIDQDIEFIKLNSIEDYIKTSGLDEDNKKLLQTAYMSQMKQIMPIFSEMDYIDLDKLPQTKGELESIINNKEGYDPIIVSAAEKLLDLIQRYDAISEKSPEINPLKEALKTLHFTINGGYENIFDIIDKQEIILSDLESLGNFSVQNELLETLKNAIRTIDVFRGIVSATIARDDGGGIAELANDYKQLYLNDNKGKYPVLFKEDAEYIYRYLNNLRRKLEDLVIINDQNSKDIRESDNETRKEHLDSLARYYKKGLSITIDGKEEQLIPLDIDEPDDQAYIDKVETHICSRLGKLKTKYGEKEFKDKFFAAIIEKFGQDIQDCDYTISDAVKMSGDNIIIKNNFIARRLVSLLHYSPVQFNQDLKEIYENNPDAFTSIVQEFDLRFILSYIHNIDLETEFIKKIGVPEGEKYVKKVLLDHTMTLFGSGGAGKTYMLGLLRDKLKSVYTGGLIVTTKEQVKLDALKKTVLKDQSSPDGKLLSELFGSEVMSISDTFETSANTALTKINEYLLKKENVDFKKETEIFNEGGILIKRVSESKFSIKVSGEEINLDYYVEFSVGGNPAFRNISISESTLGSIPFDINKNSIIAIDEATFLNPFLSQLLDYKAKKQNGLIVQIGDLTQMGFAFTGAEGVEYVFNAANIQGINLPILKGTFRCESTGKRDNISVFQNALRQSKILKDGQIVPTYQEGTINLESALNSEIYFGEHPLIYKETDSDLMGDLVVSDKDKFWEYVKKIESLGQDIIFVVDSDASRAEIKSRYNDKYKIVTLSQIQGDEADYVIGYNLKGSNNPLNFDVDLRKISMLVGRSRKFGLYYDEQGGLFTSQNVHSELKNNIQKIDVPETYATNNEETRAKLDSEINLLKEYYPEDHGEEPNQQEKKEPFDDEALETDEAEVNPEIKTPPTTEAEAQVEEKNEGVAETEKVKIFTGEGKNGVSVVHSFYTRLNLTREEATELKRINTEKDLRDFLEAHPDSEPAIVWRNLDKFKALIPDLESKITSGKELLKTLELIKDRIYVMYSAQDTFAIIGETYNKDKDWAYNKPNDFNPDSKIYLRLAYKVGSEYITLGRLGNNSQDDPRFNELQHKIYKQVAESGQTVIKDFNYKESSAGRSYVDKYISDRGLREKVKNTRFLLQYTGLRAYSISESQSNIDLFGSNLDNFYRLNLKGLSQLGITLESQQYTFKSAQDFLNWYNKYRFEPLEFQPWMTSLYKRTWFVATLDGTDFKFPILVNKILRSFKFKTNNNGHIKLYSVHKLLQGVSKVVGDPELFEGIPYNPKTEEDFDKLSNAISQLKEKIIEKEKEERKENGANAEKTIESILRELDQIVPILRDTKAFNQRDFTELLKMIDEIGKQGYFFEDSTAEISLYSTDSEDLRITKIFERPRYYLVYDQTTLVDENPQQVSQGKVEQELVGQQTEEPKVTTNIDEIVAGIEYIRQIVERSVPTNAEEINRIIDLLHENQEVIISQIITPENKENYLRLFSKLANKCRLSNSLKNKLDQIKDIRNKINTKC